MIDNELELLPVSVCNYHCSSHNHTVCLLYCPPGFSPIVLKFLHNVLESFRPSVFSSFVLVGNFNVNFLGVNHFLFSFVSDLLSSFNLQQVVPGPTRVSLKGTSTLIDLAMISQPNQLHSCKIKPPLSNSDHNGIDLKLVCHLTSRNVLLKNCPIWKYIRLNELMNSFLTLTGTLS